MEIDVFAIVEALARNLCRVDKDEDGGPHLMWPEKRDETVRVSEQESKILLCQTLEEMKLTHSIETPTTKEYRQKGVGTRSARFDVTIYGSRSRSDRKLNIELKAGNPPEESFRKDFEKLLCDGVDGLWLHTLAATNAGTMRSIFGKVRRAFAREAGHLGEAGHSLHFAFVLLKSAEVRLTTIELQRDSGSNLERVEMCFSDIDDKRRRRTDKEKWSRLVLFPPGAEWQEWER